MIWLILLAIGFTVLLGALIVWYQIKNPPPPPYVPFDIRQAHAEQRRREEEARQQERRQHDREMIDRLAEQIAERTRLTEPARRELESRYQGGMIGGPVGGVYEDEPQQIRRFVDE